MLDSAGRSLRMPASSPFITPWNRAVAALPS